MGPSRGGRTSSARYPNSPGKLRPFNLTKQTYQEEASWKEPRDGKELSCRGDMYQLPMASVTTAYCKRGLILFEEGKQLVGV